MHPSPRTTPVRGGRFNMSPRAGSKSISRGNRAKDSHCSPLDSPMPALSGTTQSHLARPTRGLLTPLPHSVVPIEPAAVFHGLDLDKLRGNSLLRAHGGIHN